MSYVRVRSVKSADYVLLKKLPPDIIVSAEGDVTTSGWRDPHLTPWVYVKPPADGILDLDFVARKPSGYVLQMITPISGSGELRDVEINDYWGKGMPLKGFRIHAAENSIEIPVGHNAKSFEPMLV